MFRVKMLLLAAACLLLFPVAAFAANVTEDGFSEQIQHTKKGFNFSINNGGDSTTWNIPKSSPLYQKAWFVEWVGQQEMSISAVIEKGAPVNLYVNGTLKDVQKRGDTYVLTIDFAGEAPTTRTKEEVLISPANRNYANAEQLIKKMKAVKKGRLFGMNFGKDRELDEVVFY